MCGAGSLSLGVWWADRAAYRGKRNISTRAGGPGAREPQIVGPRGPGEPPTRRVYRHDTPHGGFFSLRARVRLRRPVRLVCEKSPNRPHIYLAPERGARGADPGDGWMVSVNVEIVS